MTAKIRDILRIPTQIVFAVSLFSLGGFATHAYASETAVDTTTVDCQIIKPEHYQIFRFVDYKYHEGLQVFHDVICSRVEDRRWDLDKGNKVMRDMVIRCGICRDNHMNQDFEEHLKESDTPESLVLAHNHFCLRTHDPTSFARINYKQLEAQIEWLGKEFFCQVTHDFIYPSGFWEKFIEPDLPSIKQFKGRTDSICQQLRKDDITYEEAVYRWQQAELEFNQQVGAEAVKNAGKTLAKPIEVLINMFK